MFMAPLLCIVQCLCYLALISERSDKQGSQCKLAFMSCCTDNSKQAIHKESRSQRFTFHGFMFPSHRSKIHLMKEKQCSGSRCSGKMLVKSTYLFVPCSSYKPPWDQIIKLATTRPARKVFNKHPPKTCCKIRS